MHDNEFPALGFVWQGIRRAGAHHRGGRSTTAGRGLRARRTHRAGLAGPSVSAFPRPQHVARGSPLDSDDPFRHPMTSSPAEDLIFASIGICSLVMSTARP